MAHNWTYWRDLIESERSIYMEFYAPMENNLGIMPENGGIVSNQCISPTDGQINSVIDTGDNLTRTFAGFLTVGQRNAVIFWIDEHPEFIQGYMASVNEFVPAERQINDIIYLGEGDQEIVNIIENIGLMHAIEIDNESSGEESSGEESSGEESSGEESSDDDIELTDDEGLTEN